MPTTFFHSRSLLYIIGAAFALSLQAQTPNVTTRTWLWGVGHASVLDTYLSPLTYTGTDFTLLHQRSDRLVGAAAT